MNCFTVELLIKRRKQAKLSYRKLSELTKKIDPNGVGVSTMTCHRLEAGLKPSVDSLLLLCDALAISTKSLFYRTEENKVKK